MNAIRKSCANELLKFVEDNNLTNIHLLIKSLDQKFIITNRIKGGKSTIMLAALIYHYKRIGRENMLSCEIDSIHNIGLKNVESN